MDDNEYLRIIKNYIKNMPSLPVTVNKIREVCDNPKSSPTDIYKLIILDPVLTAKVMKLINSAYYSISGKVTSLARAIIMLGINTVKNLVISSSVMNIVNGKNYLQADNAKKFWRHSLCTAVAAKVIALKTGKDRNEAEEYFIAGMLHDIGKIPILACFPDQYRVIIDQCEINSGTAFETEQKIFGFNHCSIGNLIAEQWTLGEKMEMVIANHHNPELVSEDKYWEIVYIISITDYYINKIGYGFADIQCITVPPAAIFKKTGITEDMLDSIRDTIMSELEKAKVFLDFKG